MTNQHPSLFFDQHTELFGTRTKPIAEIYSETSDKGSSHGENLDYY